MNYGLKFESLVDSGLKESNFYELRSQIKVPCSIRDSRIQTFYKLRSHNIWVPCSTWDSRNPTFFEPRSQIWLPCSTRNSKNQTFSELSLEFESLVRSGTQEIKVCLHKGLKFESLVWRPRMSCKCGSVQYSRKILDMQIDTYCTSR